MIRERAPAKLNLVLHVGPTRPDGRHELCSLFAALDLADEVSVMPQPEADRDRVVCPGVEGPNLAGAALAAFRAATGADIPPLLVTVTKRIPIAAGLGGGSADAAAVLRAANALAGAPLDADGLREVGADLGSDVPSQIEPGATLVTGAGEGLSALDLPPMSLVLVPDPHGLGAGEVYAEADRLRSTRRALDPDRLTALAAAPLEELAPELENDLEPAVLSLRPGVRAALEGLRASGALAALVTGSGPTAFGVFAGRAAAEAAAEGLPGSLVTGLTAPRPSPERSPGPPEGDHLRARPVRKGTRRSE